MLWAPIGHRFPLLRIAVQRVVRGGNHDHSAGGCWRDRASRSRHGKRGSLSGFGGSVKVRADRPVLGGWSSNGGCKLMDGSSPHAGPRVGQRAFGAPMKAVAAYRGVLEIREARVLIGASAVSQVGDWLYNAALLGYVFSCDALSCLGRRSHALPLASLRAARAVRRRRRGPSSPPNGVGGGKPAAPRAHARTGGGGRWPCARLRWR